MRVTYEVKDAGGLQQAVIRTVVRDLFVGAASMVEGGRPDVRRTTVEKAVVVVMEHAVLSDGGQAFRTPNGCATPAQIIQALRDDVFRPSWCPVSETDEPLQ